MRKDIVLAAMAASVLALWLSSCAEKKADEETTTPVKQVKAVEEGPETLHAIDKAVQSPKLPFVIAGGEVSFDCFEASTEVVKGSDFSLKDRAKDSGEAQNMQATVRAWLASFLNSTSVDESLVNSWELEMDDYFVVEANPDALALGAREECWSRKSGWLKKGVIMVNSLVGARTIRGKMLTPLSEDQRVSMGQAIGAGGMKLEWKEPEKNFFKSPPQPQPQQQPQQGQGGAEAAPNEPPPPQPKEFTLSIPDGVFFARRGDLPKHYGEVSSKKCNTYLIWGDPSFREPECEELPNAKFKVAKVDENNVEVTVQGPDGQPQSVKISYDNESFVRLGKRLGIWIKPVKGDTEGCAINLDSIGLGTPSDAGVAKTAGFEARESKVEKPVAKEEPKAKPKEKKEKKEKKKKGSSSDDIEIPLK